MSIERIAKNDATFRAANEKIEDTATGFGMKGDIPFICECADPACTSLLTLPLEDYQEMRLNPRWFLNIEGHEVPSVEAGAVKVVERRGSYLIVEKLGVAAVIAEQTAGIKDPLELAELDL